MLHDSRNQDIGPVADRVHFQLLALQIFIHQDGMILRNAVDNFHELFHFLIGNGDLHALAAQHIGRTHQNRITQPVCHGFGFLRRIYGSAGRPWYPALLQNLIK